MIGYRKLRFIGGPDNGKSIDVPDSRQTAVRTVVETTEPKRTTYDMLRVESKEVEHTYVRRMESISLDRFHYTEEVMVWDKLPRHEIAPSILSLGFPKVDFPTMKPLAIRPSAAVKSAAYCERTKNLDVSLGSTGAYRYHDVPKDLVFDFVTSPSLGRFYGDRIRNKFKMTRLA